MTKYGYARVSSKSQEENSSLEAQKQQLIKNGKTKIITKLTPLLVGKTETMHFYEKL